MSPKKWIDATAAIGIVVPSIMRTVIKMRKIIEKDFNSYIPWAKNGIANTVYPCSIAEGFQSGDIYVNDDGDVESVLFWHYCGFGYISGKVSEKMMTDIYSEMVSNHNGRRLVLITSDEDVIDFFHDRDVVMDSRAEYSYHQGAATVINTDEFQIERINPENISQINGRIIPSFSWESRDQFLKEGFGYIALDNGRVCAVAFSSSVSTDEIDIGVETHEDYRRKGLAAILASKMCERIVETGKRPVWAHSISNKGSMNTALKCGFVQDKINTVIRKNDN